MTNSGSKPIHILLASFNGSKHISSQISSIINQSYNNINLTIRDDGSSDNTVTTIKEFICNSKKYNIELIENESFDIGHCKNFSGLCESILTKDLGYFCFSDQDDVWLPEKVSVLQTRMIELETLHGKGTPILIHSDLSVVDEQLNEIAPSFIEYQGLPNPSDHSFPEFLYQNVVTGCACMFNRALLDIAAPIPSHAVVHDWWFALCAEYFGVVDFINQPLVKYRQHGNNAIGAISAKQQYNLLSPHIYKALMRFPQHLSKSIDQAGALLNRIENKHINENNKRIIAIEQFSNIKQSNVFARASFVKQYMKGKRSFGKLVYLYLVFTLVKWF